jgi:TolA-binding protein
MKPFDRLRAKHHRPRRTPRAPSPPVVSQLLRRLLSASLLAGALTSHSQVPVQPVTEAEAGLRARAYELYQAKRFGEAAEQFRLYLDRNQRDARVLFDYASLLLQLHRHDEAARALEQLHQLQPRHEAGYFRLGATYVNLGRSGDAERVFRELQQSSNPAMAAAAGEALQKLGKDEARTARIRAETHVFELARAGDHTGVLAAIGELEKNESLSFALELQRLYALSALHRFAEGLPRAEQLARTHPDSVELALVQADFLAQLERRSEAEVIWRRVAQRYPGTAAALEANRRLQERVLPPPEDHVYDLVRQQRHREALAAIEEMEKAGALPWSMEMQRIYSLQALNEFTAATHRADELAAKNPEASDLALLRADLLAHQHAWFAAARTLKEVEQRAPESDTGHAARARMRALPAVANLDKWYWGEAYAAGDYLGRYDALVGSGFIRTGTFIPEARWLQPYAEHIFGVDTASSATRSKGQTIIFDNAVGFYGGMRLQVIPTEYLFFYVQGGVNKDLLDQRDDGDWALDSQAGVYGFKSWGPGVAFLPKTTPAAAAAETPASAGLFWRGDWFADAGANFSYYDRYSSWIGYGQAHEGFRLGQWGKDIAFDAYLLENIAWDVRGNFYDNYADFGPGARIIWRPRPQWQVVLNCEWLQGYYFGRNERGNRNGTDADYNGVHVGLSVGARW